MPSILTRSRAAWRAFFHRQPARRGFDAARGSRLLSDWVAQATSSDAEIRRSIRRLIDRSRDLERNNDYQRGFLLSCERNVIGAVRDDLRMDCGEEVPGGRNSPPKWQADPAASAAIEKAWRDWGKRGTCTVCGRYSWRDVKRLGVRSLARDGNIFTRKIFGPAAGNRFGFALQLWEVDHLDLDKFDTLRGGGEIRFGIETNADGRVVAYHVRARHPGDTQFAAAPQTVRMNAAEFYHLFISERAEQSIGFPMIVSAITRLRQLGAFEEAAVIAARLGASKQGFFKRTAPESGDMEEGKERDDQDRIVMDAAPGTFEQLPDGFELQDWSPEYPNIATGEFRKAMLRGVGTSLGMSYNTLGNDLEAVNFSSARVGLFEEREGWKALQVFLAENYFEAVFADFLPSAILAGALNLPLSKLEKFNRPIFKARRWPFIDPLKEVNAAKTAIALRLTSRRQVIEEGGGSVDDVFHDNHDDEALAEEIGLSLTPADPQPEVSIGADPDGDPIMAAAPGKKGAKAAPARAMPTAAEIAAEVLRQTPAAPVAAPANVTINNSPPAVSIAPAAITINTPDVRNEITVAPAPAPNVTVEAAPAQRSEPPIVNVTVPQAAAPIVNVTVPPLNATLSLSRDGDGKLAGGKIT